MKKLDLVLEEIGWGLLSAAIPLEILMFAMIFTLNPKLFFGSLALFGISGFLGLYLVCRRPKGASNISPMLLLGRKTIINKGG